MLIFPEFNPIALQLGPLAIHWYGLAYVAALAGGLFIAKRMAKAFPAKGLKVEMLDDFFVYAVVGVIAGGRLGYILFYNLQAYLADPLEIFKVWHGGMSFHGGVLGVTAAFALFAWRHKVPVLALADRVVMAVPLGCLLGRLANFINGELVGRVTSETLPWAMVFPAVDPFPRHPSQLYQAGMEGIVVGLVMLLALRYWAKNKTPQGLLVGVWLLAYGLARISTEPFRTPEIMYGGLITQGQMLCVPMLIGGAYLAWRSLRIK